MMEVKDIESVINRPNAMGDTVLHDACRKNMPNKAALLIKNGAKIMSNSRDEMPAFSLLSSYDDSTVESFLEVLQDEVDISDFVNKPNNSRDSPLQLACYNNEGWKAMLLWAAGAKPEARKFSEILMWRANLHPWGIQHVVECPSLADLLET